MYSTGFTCVNKIQQSVWTAWVKRKRWTTLNFCFKPKPSTRSFVFYLSKASQIHARNRRKIYATVEIHLWCLVSNCLLLSLVPSNNWPKETKTKRQTQIKKKQTNRSFVRSGPWRFLESLRDWKNVDRPNTIPTSRDGVVPWPLEFCSHKYIF